MSVLLSPPVLELVSVVRTGPVLLVSAEVVALPVSSTQLAGFDRALGERRSPEGQVSSG